MSLGPLMIDLQCTVLQAEERDMLRHPLVGGIILFTRNYENTDQLRALIDAVHAVREPRLLIAVDQEGGRVQRFRSGFTRLPPVAELGRIANKDPARALSLAETTGWLMAAELRAVGVDLSFAPVLDLDHRRSSVIGDRAFHRNPEVLTELAHAYMLGMRHAGMAAVGKHFPGHGGVAADSHLELPEDKRSLADLRAEDLLPFERMIHYGLPAVMAAHVVYPAVAPLPAGFSYNWLHTLLRRELGFQGAVFSDDLSMAGARVAGATPTQRAHVSLEAGCDMVLICNDRPAVIEVLENLDYAPNPASQLRLTRLHGRHQRNLQELQNSPQWRKAVEMVRSYDADPMLDLDL
ncbi:MAG: beta-N-acetylhexosaminidase [Proteobacteria bacterium]|nr:MAG: beta-N-acetylhexosaminidase [Pseudomonadota bacterium]QKK12451.1 MAG: beta-N-acetylhexosaminidase [Pseudomonadota bacterium]